VIRSAVVLAAIARVASADPPLPDPGSPTVPLPLPADPNVRSPDDAVRSPDVDGIGVMSIRRGTFADADVSIAHELEGNVAELVPGARWSVAPDAFVDLALPLAYQHATGETALGNAMLGVGYLPADDRMVGIELRVAAPTSPSNSSALAELAPAQVAQRERVLPHTTSAELVADWRWRGDDSAWWLQPEAGLAGWWQPIGYTTVARATLAGGARVLPWLELTASFVTRLSIVSRDSSTNFVHSVLVGAVLYGALALRAEVPVDGAARDDHRVVIGLELRAW
jgi:hypothetical protein